MLSGAAWAIATHVAARVSLTMTSAAIGHAPTASPFPTLIHPCRRAIPHPFRSPTDLLQIGGALWGSFAGEGEILR